MHLIAQATEPATQPGTDSVTPPWWATHPEVMLYAMLGIALLYIILGSGRQTRQAEKQLKQMLANLKRGDRIQTIGGILGSVVEARENEVVIKVDESTNTKIRVMRDAIKKVVVEESEGPAK
jgi:preprotein translocase subunit YajC